MAPGRCGTMKRAFGGTLRSAAFGPDNGLHGPHVAQGGRLAVVATPALAKDAALVGEIREVSVVMADLRGFTAFCERVPPDRMYRVLNEYLTAMIDVILGQQGHVQDFIGDGILGVFGAPGQDLDHGWHAALSAVEMQAAIRQLGRRWGREEGTPFGLGVAVHGPGLRGRSRLAQAEEVRGGRRSRQYGGETRGTKPRSGDGDRDEWGCLGPGTGPG